MIVTMNDIVGVDMNETIHNITLAIKQDLISPRQSQAKAGVDYYNNKGDILKAEKYYFDANGEKQVDVTRANNRVTHSFYPLLVKQKVGYLLGKPMNFMSSEEGVGDYLNKVLGEKWNSVVQELLKNASNKGDEWLYCYIDRDGDFNYLICPTEQIIPIYDTAFKTNLEGVIRYYTVTDLSNTKKWYVEFWTADEVMYFETINDSLVLVDRKAHFTVNGVDYSFGCVPFIQFKNNEEQSTDLSLVKDLIDQYDKVVSGLANDLEDIQDTIYVLKGYQGTDPNEFMSNLRYYKLIKVDEDGSVDKLEVHIPIEAKDSLLKRLEDDIYRLGMGVDVSAEKLGNSSGVALKFIYSLLDLKCDMAEAQFKKSIRHLLKIISTWYKVQTGVGFDRDKVQITFNRSFIINTKEQINNVVNSIGLVSRETLLSNHPFVTDVDYEVDTMKQEGITPAWLNTSDVETDETMTSGGYENTGENTTD